MEAKKTIAILGLGKGDEKSFLDQLANDNRLLIVSNDRDNCAKVADYLSQNRPEEEVELIDCPKDGCWEADIILIWNPKQHPQALMERLQSVAIQKIVVMITKEPTHDLPLFPHSKIIILTINPDRNEVNITGEDQEALHLIKQIIRRTGVFKIETHI